MNELIAALRICSSQPCCDNCPRYDIDHAQETNDCCVHLLEDAADALEAADEKIADYTAAIDALDDSNDAYIKENERLKKRIADLETALAACRMRKGEAPKRGEWEERYIEDANPMFRRRFYCSRCGEWTTHGKTRYCPNCGAVMGGKEKTNADS